MNLQKKNLLRRMSILVSLLLAIFSLSACSGDDDDDDKVGNAGTVTAKSIVGVWYALGYDNSVTYTFSESGNVRISTDNGYTKDFSYEMAGDGGYFTGDKQNSFEFIGPYILIHYEKYYYNEYSDLLYKKENLRNGSLSDFKGEFSSSRWGTITFNGDGTGKTNWDMTTNTQFQYTSEGKNYAHLCGYNNDGKKNYFVSHEALIYEDHLYLSAGKEVEEFIKVK